MRSKSSVAIRTFWRRARSSSCSRSRSSSSGRPSARMKITEVRTPSPSRSSTARTRPASSRLTRSTGCRSWTMLYPSAWRCSRTVSTMKARSVITVWTTNSPESPGRSRTRTEMSSGVVRCRSSKAARTWEASHEEASGLDSSSRAGSSASRTPSRRCFTVAVSFIDLGGTGAASLRKGWSGDHREGDEDRGRTLRGQRGPGIFWSLRRADPGPREGDQAGHRRAGAADELRIRHAPPGDGREFREVGHLDSNERQRSLTACPTPTARGVSDRRQRTCPAPSRASSTLRPKSPAGRTSS